MSPSKKKAARRRGQAMTEWVVFMGLIACIVSPVAQKHGMKVRDAFAEATRAIASIGDLIAGNQHGHPGE